MSHTTAIKAVKLTSITAIRAAVATLASQGVKVSLVEGAKPRAYFPDQPGMGKADFVIVLGDAPYDIGLYKQPDGSYEPRTDFYKGSVERVLGTTASKPEYADQAKLGKLFQAYAVEATVEAARKKGLQTRRIVGQDGTIKVELTGAGL